MVIPSACYKHNNLCQTTLKGTVLIRLQSHYETPCRLQLNNYALLPRGTYSYQVMQIQNFESLHKVYIKLG